jgi:mycothiol synthase
LTEQPVTGRAAIDTRIVDTRIVDGRLAEVDAVLALIERAERADGFAAVNEAGRLSLATGGAGRLHVLAGPVGEPTAYAAVERPIPSVPGPAGAGPAGAGLSAELVVDPRARRRGLGTAVLRRLLAAVAETDFPGAGPAAVIALWAHRNTAAARALAESVGLVETRVLLLLGRDLTAPPPLPAAPLPSGVRLAAFRPGIDDDAWLAVNAAAFAGHPEQGRWTAADLNARISEPWFDAAGFLLAWGYESDGGESDGDESDGGESDGDEPAGDLLGYHWTKVGGEHSPDGSPIGEIYVLGVAPHAAVHGVAVRGLGTALGVAGLDYLHGRGVHAVELYVEADNERALGIYRRLGFTESSRDVQWSGTATSPTSDGVRPVTEQALVTEPDR